RPATRSSLRTGRVAGTAAISTHPPTVAAAAADPRRRPGASSSLPRPTSVAVRPLAAAAARAAPVAQTLSSVYRRRCQGSIPAALLYTASTAQDATTKPTSLRRRDRRPARPRLTSSAAGMDEAGLVGEDDRLGAV